MSGFLRPSAERDKEIPARESALASRANSAHFAAAAELNDVRRMTDEVPKPFLPRWLRIVLIGRRPSVTLVRIALLVVVMFTVFGFILLPVRVSGPSMLPNYRNGGVNLVNRFAYLRHEPRRGDVVTIRISGDEYSAGELFSDLGHFRVQFRRLFRPSMMYMKRVVGLPGESIAFFDGQLLVNGQPLDEPYLKFSCHWEHEPIILGADQFFLVGDNRSMRMEDHTFLAKGRKRIVGKILL
jgi:signal peptidase I